MAPPKIIAITGASAGIGRATAVRLARDGASVAICARRGDLLSQVATAIVVSSIVGKRGVPYIGTYSATKFAQVGLAESLRAELTGSKIHVSVVFPVSTETEFFDVMSHETGAPVQRNIGPRQSADQVANAIARAIERPVPEVYPYAKSKSRGLVWLNALAPGLCDRFINKFGRKPVAGPGRDA